MPLKNTDRSCKAELIKHFNTNLSVQFKVEDGTPEFRHRRFGQEDVVLSGDRVRVARVTVVVGPFATFVLLVTKINVFEKTFSF